MLEQKQEVFFGLGVAGKNDFAAVCGGQMNVEHLHGSELFEHSPRSQAGEGFEARFEGDLQAVGQEGDEPRGWEALRLTAARQPKGCRSRKAKASPCGIRCGFRVGGGWAGWPGRL